MNTKELFDTIVNLINKYRETQMLDRFTPYHWEAEADAEFTAFIEWLKTELNVQ